MREWKYPALFVLMTAMSAAVMVMGDVLAGLAGVLLFGVGGAVCLTVSRLAAREATAHPTGVRYGALPGLSAHTTASGGLVFAQSRAAAALAVVGSAAFVATGALMVLGGSGSFMRPAAGALGVVFFGTTFLVGIPALLGRGGIVLVPDGVYLRAPAGAAWIRWEDLAAVRLADGVQFRATSPDAVRLTGLNRWLHGINRRRFGMDVAYPSQLLRAPAGVVVERIQDLLDRPSARRDLGDPTRRHTTHRE